MKVANIYSALLVCLVVIAGLSSVFAQTTTCDTVNGTRFNLEKRINAVPQNAESVDFLLNRVSPGIDLVVGAANDNRGDFTSFPGFPTSLSRAVYYVHRSGTNCAANFEGSISSFGLGTPTVVADSPRDAFFLSDNASSAASQVVEVGRTTSANLLNTATCPSGTHSTAQASKCWPLVGVANFTNAAVPQASLTHLHLAVDSRTTGTGAGDVYVAAQFINSTNFPAVASVQIIACVNGNVSCGSPVVASGTDTFAAFPYIQVRKDGLITVSYWTLTQPFGTQNNPINIKFATCTPQGAPNPPVCSAPTLVGTSSVPAAFAPSGNGFQDFLFPKHANRLEADGKSFTTFLVYDRCRSIIGTVGFFAPTCSKVDVVLSASTTNGATWSAPRMVSTAAGHQYMGTIRTDASTGTTSIAYYSTQTDPFEQRSQLLLNQIAAGSTVLGPANILTSATNDPSSGVSDLVAPNGEQVINFGDRIGIAAAGTGTTGQSRVYVHYTWNNVAGISNGVSQPDPNNTLVPFSY